MDSHSVFRSLLEIFPQVDARILKAVAIEHSKDVDAAAEFLLCEVLTSMSGSSDVLLREQDNMEQCPVNPPFSGESVEVLRTSYVGGSEEPLRPPFNGELVEVSRTSYVGGSEEHCPDHEIASPLKMNPLGSRESDCNNDEMVTNIFGNNEDNLLLNAEPEEASTVEHMVNTELEASAVNSEPEIASSSQHVVPLLNLEGNGSSDLFANIQELNESQAEEVNSFSHTDCNALSTILDEHPVLMENEAEGKDVSNFLNESEEQIQACSFGHASTVSTATSSENMSLFRNDRCSNSLHCGPVMPNNFNSAFVECEDHHSTCRIEGSFEQSACGSEMVSLEENVPPTTLATRSGHVVNIELLEDFVTDAKSNKQTLVSSVESIINMVKESEVLEERAKEAREEASLAGQETFAKVVELEEMLKRAQQANDMHAGEIYGEKSILSTEARELQSRLLSLSDERNRSFSIMEEMHHMLEARLVAARDEIAAAEQEKLEKESSAQKALKKQEVVMEMIVEESNKLHKEAEENAKLREFLMDHGQVVDTLQGELAVIYEDLILLKERVDGRLPLNRSLLRAYSSSLSSSSSSQRSVGLSDRVPNPVELGESPRENEDHLAAGPKVDYISDSCELKYATDNSKLSADDDWEVCNREVSP